MLTDCMVDHLRTRFTARNNSAGSIPSALAMRPSMETLAAGYAVSVASTGLRKMLLPAPTRDHPGNVGLTRNLGILSE